MPKRNPARSVLDEEHLARRVQLEREARGWTYDGLAERMTRAGCAMQGSALFKIEKATPRRRITVNELVAFSSVFELSMDELVTDPVLASVALIKPLLKEWFEALETMDRLNTRRHVLSEQIRDLTQGSPDVLAAAERYLDVWHPEDPGEAPREGVGSSILQVVMGRPLNTAHEENS